MIVDSLQTFGQMLKIRSENLKSQTLGGSTMNLSSDSHGSAPTLRGGQSVQNLSTFDPNETETSSRQQIPGMPSFDDILFREVGFVMLQLVNGLKNIQAKGIEELPLSLSNVILCKELENKESQARLHVLHGYVFFCFFFLGYLGFTISLLFSLLHLFEIHKIVLIKMYRVMRKNLLVHFANVRVPH